MLSELLVIVAMGVAVFIFLSWQHCFNALLFGVRPSPVFLFDGA